MLDRLETGFCASGCNLPPAGAPAAMGNLGGGRLYPRLTNLYPQYYPKIPMTQIGIGLSMLSRMHSLLGNQFEMHHKTRLWMPSELLD